MLPFVQRPGNGAADIGLQQLDQVIDQRFDQHSGRVSGLLRDFALERQKCAYQLNIRLHRSQQLRLE
ncbi:hypothetical protein D3C85_1643970 [compost metagenome]